MADWSDEDVLEELRVLTASWDDARRRALMAACAEAVAEGVPAHAAWVIALGRLLG